MKKVFFIALYCILIAVPFFSVPKGEGRFLAEIDRLIQETEYDAALSALHDFFETYPERFDDGQHRADRIFKTLDRYTAISLQLIDAIETEPENGRKILEIIAKLESLKKNSHGTTACLY